MNQPHILAIVNIGTQVCDLLLVGTELFWQSYLPRREKHVSYNQERSKRKSKGMIRATLSICVLFNRVKLIQLKVFNIQWIIPFIDGWVTSTLHKNWWKMELKDKLVLEKDVFSVNFLTTCHIIMEEMLHLIKCHIKVDSLWTWNHFNEGPIL